MGYSVIRCAHTVLPLIRAAMVSVTKIGGEEATIHVLLVSGSLKALKRKMQNILKIEDKKELCR